MKIETGDIACSSESIIPNKTIKKIFGDKLPIIADVCNCNILNMGIGTIKNNDVDNDSTNKTLANQSLV